jgi:hypothetical protein
MDASETGRLIPGQRVSRYEVLEYLGEGGAGAVYKARDTELQRTVALKVLARENLRDRDERFRQEARTASSLNHPNITTVYEIGRDGDTEFIAMEYVAGRTLADVLAAGKLPWREAAGYAAAIADALVTAHDVGIVHRDLHSEGARLWAGEGDRDGDRRPGVHTNHTRLATHAGGRSPGNRRVHVAGAGGGPARGHAVRYLRVWSDAV